MRVRHDEAPGQTYPTRDVTDRDPAASDVYFSNSARSAPDILWPHGSGHRP